MLLPCWRQIFLDTGQRPVVIVSREFAGVLHGVSYVQADVINGHWYTSIATIAKYATLKYGEFKITQCHGLGHSTDQNLYETFGHAMWAHAGFGHVPYGSLPLVFDRRNPEREAKLISRVRHTNKPLLLYNLHGFSSPLPAAQAVRHRLRRYEYEFEMVNLGAIRAAYIYDLLGLYDIAAGLISIDTSTAHLASASEVRTLAYVRGDWSGAIPKASAERILYKDSENLDLLDRFVASLKT